MNKHLFESNKITFAEFNIGDKVTITHSMKTFEREDVIEFGIVKKFGYNCTDELILGVEMIVRDDVASNDIRWFHPRNKISSVEKLAVS